MSENGETVRPTKKQREILTYIEQFIGEHGYSPSYREIMNGLQYTSVATVALHVNSLIRRGHLRKRDRSARSLEVVASTISSTSSSVDPNEQKWLVDRVDALMTAYESSDEKPMSALKDLKTMFEALKIIGLAGAAKSFEARLAAGQAISTGTLTETEE